MNEYFNGEKLFGDDFDKEKIEEWFNDEKEAYASLSDSNDDFSKNHYAYYALNKYNGYFYVPLTRFENILSIGGASGNEISPIIDNSKNIFILEPSEKFKNANKLQNKFIYLKPNILGDFPFDNEFFDLITCFGTLHHIPNVTKVVSEIYRCMKNGGYLLIREPIVSLGDWTKQRHKGLTNRERGIPKNIFRKIINDCNFEIISSTPCIFAPLAKLGRILKYPIYNNNILVKVDKILSKIFLFNYKYHSENIIHKFTPTSMFYVLKK